MPTKITFLRQPEGGGGGDMLESIYDPAGKTSQITVVADIVNNLTTTSSTRPLSATQGKVLKDAITEFNAAVDGNGVVSGVQLSINADNTKFDIASGVYRVIGLPNVVYAGASAVVLTYLATNLVTYVGINITSGLIIQKTTPFTHSERRTHILLGAVIHSNKTTVNAINNLPDVAVNGISQFNDTLDSLGMFNVSGNKISANGANLFINKSIGYICKRGVNFEIDSTDPHVKELPALTAPSNIRYRLSDSTEYADTQSVSLFYESAPGVRTALEVNRYSIQRVALFSSNLIRIQYGQASYLSMAAALQAIQTESFTYEANIRENGLIICFLIIKGSVTDLTNTATANFVYTDKFGQLPLGGGAGTTTLQQAYNNSIIPQITTTTDLGALSVKRGSDADTDIVFDIIDGSDVSRASITGDGRVLKQGVLAEIHCRDASTPQDIPTGATYTKLTAFTDNGLSKNATADVANDKITLTKAGIYRVSSAISMLCDTNNVSFQISAFLNDVEQSNVHFERKLATLGDIGSGSMTGFISVSSVPVDADIRVRHDDIGTVALTVTYANFNLEYISEI